MRDASAVALGVCFATQFVRAPLIAASGIAAAAGLAVLPSRWTAGLSCVLIVALTQGTESWAGPLLAAMFLISPRLLPSWGRVPALAALAILWGAVFTSGLSPAGFWKSAGIGNLMAFVLLHVLILDPEWIPGRAPGTLETVFYDGHCGLCHHTVQFLLQEDGDGSRFRFAPLDSDAFRKAVPEDARARLPDSVVVMAGFQPLVRSRAALHVLSRLGGLWRVLGGIARIIPRPVADGIYDWIAGVRHRIFKRPKDVCPLMPPEYRGRFLFD